MEKFKVFLETPLVPPKQITVGVIFWEEKGWPQKALAAPLDWSFSLAQILIPLANAVAKTQCFAALLLCIPQDFELQERRTDSVDFSKLIQEDHSLEEPRISLGKVASPTNMKNPNKSRLLFIFLWPQNHLAGVFDRSELRTL